MADNWISISGFISNCAGTAAIIAFIGVVLRETISKFFTASVENRFELKLEAARAEFRKREIALEASFSVKAKEFDHIISFLSAQKRERDTLIQQKKIDAAENLLRFCNKLSQLNTLVETMKIIKIDAVEAKLNDPKITIFFQMLVKSSKVDERFAMLDEIDQILPRLYLSQHALACADAYRLVVVHSAMAAKLLSMGESTRFLKSESLRTEVEKIFPHSKSGFDQYGNDYAYYWAQSLYNETLNAIRSESTGVGQDSADAISVRNLAMATQSIQIDIKRIQSEVPDEIRVKDAEIPEAGPFSRSGS